MSTNGFVPISHKLAISTVWVIGGRAQNFFALKEKWCLLREILCQFLIRAGPRELREIALLKAMKTWFQEVACYYFASFRNSKTSLLRNDSCKLQGFRKLFCLCELMIPWRHRSSDCLLITGLIFRIIDHWSFIELIDLYWVILSISAKQSRSSLPRKACHSRFSTAVRLKYQLRRQRRLNLITDKTSPYYVIC